jgi:hypothetical protein
MRIIATISAAIALLASSGCVERELSITSSPPGAIVYVSDVEVGRTPMTMDFTWYGDYDVVLRRDGYRTLKTHADLDPPVYEIPPIDLFSAIAPWTYHDRRYLHYDLEKASLPSEEELISRADAMAAENALPVAR